MKLVKLSGEAERATQTTVDTIEITKKLAASWKSPPFQRDLHATPKVLGLVDELKVTGVLPGIVTLGVLDGEVYIVDGQHRLHAFLVSDMLVVYADVRTHYFKTLGAMADEYVKLNSSLVRLRPDDILRGLETTNTQLQLIRRKCPYVGYDLVRRGPTGPVLSMSTILRVWAGSRYEVPSQPGMTAAAVLTLIDATEAAILTDFLVVAFTAWRRDQEYWPLWGSLNLILCAWLYRRVVIGAAGKGTSRATRLTVDDFRKGLVSLSADSSYLEYLVGRRVNERDRAPAYGRIKTIFTRRYAEEHDKAKLTMPQPGWAHAGK